MVLPTDVHDRSFFTELRLYRLSNGVVVLRVNGLLMDVECKREVLGSG